MTHILRRAIGLGLALLGVFMILQKNFALEAAGFVLVSLGIIMSLGK